MVISLVHQVFLSFKQLPPSTTRTQNVTEMQHCAISYHYHTLLTQIRLQPLSCRQADSVSGRQTHRQATCVDDLLRFLFNICHRWRQADNASHGRNVLPHKTASSPLVKTSRLAGQRPDLVSLTTCQPSTQTSLTHWPSLHHDLPTLDPDVLDLTRPWVAMCISSKKLSTSHSNTTHAFIDFFSPFSANHYRTISHGCIKISAVCSLHILHVQRANLYSSTSCYDCFHSVLDTEVEQGLMSHQTHYKSYRGRVSTGQMTQPTVSKHWKKVVPKG